MFVVSGHPPAPRGPERRGGDPRHRSGRARRPCSLAREVPIPSAPAHRLAAGGQHDDGGLGHRQADRHRHVLDHACGSDLLRGDAASGGVLSGRHAAPSPRRDGVHRRAHGALGVVRLGGRLLRRPAVAVLGGHRQPRTTLRQRCALRADRRYQPQGGQSGVPTHRGRAFRAGGLRVQPLRKRRQETRPGRPAASGDVGAVRRRVLQHIPVRYARHGLRLAAGGVVAALGARGRAPTVAAAHRIRRTGRVGGLHRGGVRLSPHVRRRVVRPRCLGSAAALRGGLGRGGGADRGDVRGLGRFLQLDSTRQAPCPLLHIHARRANLHVRRGLIPAGGALPVPVRGRGRGSRARQIQQREPRWRRRQQRPHRRRVHARRQLHGGSHHQTPRRHRRLHAEFGFAMRRRGLWRHRRNGNAVERVERRVPAIVPGTGAPYAAIHRRLTGARPHHRRRQRRRHRVDRATAGRRWPRMAERRCSPAQAR